jgi:hypothetical protein
MNANNNCGVCGEVDDDYWTHNGVAHCEKCNAKWCKKWMEDDIIEDSDDEEEFNPLAGLTAKQIARIERIRMERAEKRVDERDHPNIFPYKMCGFCHERSSCGNYTEDDVWQCEGCDDNRECCENCHDKTSREEWTDYMGNDILYCDECYERHRVRIERKCKECRFRQSFPNNDLCNICEPHECESEEEYEYEPGEKEYIEAVKNGDFEEMVRLDTLKRNKLI